MEWAALPLLLIAHQSTAQSPIVENISPSGTALRNSATAAAKPGTLVRLTIHAPFRAGEVDLLLAARKAGITHRQSQGSTHQLTFRIPPNAVEGCHVPLHLVRHGKQLPDSIEVAISATGACRVPSYQPTDAWLSKKTAIAARIETTEWSLETGGAHSTVEIVSAFVDGSATTLQPGPLLRFPPPGLCASGSRSYVPGTPTIDILLPLLFDEVNGAELDSGELLTLDDGRYQTKLQRVVGHAGLFWKTAASSLEEFPQLNTKGNLYLRGTGGRDVPPFIAMLPPPPAFEWLNRPTSPLVSLRSRTALTWNAPVAGLVLIAAIAVDPQTARFSYCLCVAPPVSQRFEFPTPLLASLVASTGQGRESAGSIYLIHLPQTIRPFPSHQLDSTATLSLRMLSAKVLFHQ